MIEPGTYTGIVRGTRFKEAKTGSLGLGVRFELPSGDFIWGDVWFTQKAEGIARRSMKALGCVGPDGDIGDLGALEENPDLLNGNEVEIEIEEEEYNGTPRLKVKNIGSPAVKPGAERLAKITKMLRDAKGKDGGPKKKDRDGRPIATNEFQAARDEGVDREEEEDDMPAPPGKK